MRLLRLQAKEFIKSMEPVPQITYLVGMTHDSDHYEVEGELSEWSAATGISVVPAFDGMQISLI